MAWISGTTISPTNHELLFVIDENANLPAASQAWVQRWTVCQGIEPIIPEVGSPVAQAPTYSNTLWNLGVNGHRGRHDFDAEGVATHLLEDVEPDDARPANEVEAEKDSKCTVTTRTLTYRLANFDINDGGDSVATTTGCIGTNCVQLSIRLKTRGTNPSRAILDAAFPNDIMRAIGWRESRWAPFLPDGKPKFNVNNNGTMDWGLMQINQATFEQQWNWRSNLARAISLFDEKRVHAQVYLNRHPENVTAEMLDNEQLQRYNGGTYYTWDALSSTWIARPPNGYVAGVRAIMAAKPWQ